MLLSASKPFLSDGAKTGEGVEAGGSASGGYCVGGLFTFSLKLTLRILPLAAAEVVDKGGGSALRSKVAIKCLCVTKGIDYTNFLDMPSLP